MGDFDCCTNGEHHAPTQPGMYESHRYAIVHGYNPYELLADGTWREHYSEVDGYGVVEGEDLDELLPMTWIGEPPTPAGETDEVKAAAWDEGFAAAVEAMHGDASHDNTPNPYRHDGFDHCPGCQAEYQTKEASNG